MEMFFHRCSVCRRHVMSVRFLSLSVVCVLFAVAMSQNAQSPDTKDIVTDPTIIITTNTTLTQTSPGEGEGGEGGGGGEEAAEGAEGSEGAEGQEGTEGPEGAEGQEGAAGQEGAESQGQGGEGQEGAEGGEAGEEAEGTEGPEREEAEGGQEFIEDQIEDLVEQYRKQGLTASLEALQTMYPGVNMSDIMMEDLHEMEEGGSERDEGAENENELQGSEGTIHTGSPPPGLHVPLQPLASDAYGDYEMDFMGQPKASYRYQPAGPDPKPVLPKTGIEPTPVQRPGTANTEGVKARLFDIPDNPGPFNPNKVQRHQTGMTVSATFGIVVGTIILSWLIVGPAVCMAWRWKVKRQEKRRTLLQRPHMHGSVDEGIMEAMVLSELGKAGSKAPAAASRRQRAEDVEESLTRNRSELQSFPTTTTLESRVI